MGYYRLHSIVARHDEQMSDDRCCGKNTHFFSCFACVYGIMGYMDELRSVSVCVFAYRREMGKTRDSIDK